MHLHVGSNIPGYAPESDNIACFDTIESAIEALRHEISDQQDFFSEGCEATSPEQQEKGSDCCWWCELAGDCEAVLSAIADGDAANHVRSGLGRMHTFSPPSGADVAHWLLFAEGERARCGIAQEQDA